jgi:carboxymethylenebutenolidase
VGINIATRFCPALNLASAKSIRRPEAAALKVPVLGLYGGADNGIPQESIEKMRAALQTSSKSQIIVYSDAPHAFFADYRPSYRKDAAEDGWKRLQDWFKSNLARV